MDEYKGKCRTYKNLEHEHGFLQSGDQISGSRGCLSDTGTSGSPWWERLWRFSSTKCWIWMLLTAGSARVRAMLTGERKCSSGESLQSTPLSDSLQPAMDCSLPRASVHGILQTRTLEWAAMPFSRGSSTPGIKPTISYVDLYCQAGSLPLVPPGKPCRWRVVSLFFLLSGLLQAGGQVAKQKSSLQKPYSNSLTVKSMIDLSQKTMVYDFIQFLWITSFVYCSE